MDNTPQDTPKPTPEKVHFFHPIDNSVVHIDKGHGLTEQLVFRDRHVAVDFGSDAHRALEDTVLKCPYGPIKKVPTTEIPDMALARQETINAAAKAIQKIANAQVK
jgi:hypothetical protein